MKLAGTLFVAFVTLGTALTPALLAQDKDADLEKAVWAALKKDKLDKEVVEVVVTNGVVVLRGKPRHAYAKMKAIETALAVEGVESVESELEVAGPESMKDLAEDLVDRVLTYSNYTVFDDVNFQILEEGTIVLGGYVTMGFKKDELEERVAKVRGVRELQSTIEVLPVSQGDERIRDQLYQRIYGDPIFQHYSRMAHPPIHIIVMRNRVMLTGAVANRIEKRQAEAIARSTPGVIQIENRLLVNP
jgi:osmotically-inducible protein OsmY